MLLILLSWIYIFITTTNFGFLFITISKIKDCNVSLIQIFGLFLYTICTSFFAFFIRINIEYYALILILNIITTICFRAQLKLYFKSLFLTFRTFKRVNKIFFLFLFVTLLAQSSTKPYLLDNETYYIQTIKWINDYGFVKGLANIHMFFGQSSSWHVLQAGFNFPFFSDIFNDLNGYLFVIFSFVAFKKINNYGIHQNVQSLCLGFVLVFTLFLIQFINSPSPDLIIFLITPYIFYLFITKYNSITTNDFKIILSLTVFICFVKVTTSVVLILPLVLFIKHYKDLKKSLWYYLLLSVIAFGVFVVKNTIISGYPLYPISQIDIIDFEWKVPKEILEFYKLGTYLEGMSNVDVTQIGFFEKIKLWLSLPKLDGLFNKAYVLLLIIFPLLLYKNKYRVSLLFIYAVAIIQLVVLWFTSPQYRFFFVFVSFLTIQLLVHITKNRKAMVYLVYLSILLAAIPVFINVNLSAFTNNDFAMNLNTFKLNNIVIPQKITKTKTEFTKHKINGFEFYSPNKDVFFWITGNGTLPCVNKKQIDYIKYRFNYIPQLRDVNLKDGFKSIEVEK